MCREQDRFIVSEHHFNAQLTARWENASRCATHQKEEDWQRSLRLPAKYTYSIPGDEPDTPTVVFDVEFDKPRIARVDKSVAFLYLKITKGDCRWYVDQAECQKIFLLPSF